MNHQVFGKDSFTIDFRSAAEGADVAVLNLPKVVFRLCIQISKDAGGVGGPIDVRDAVLIAIDGDGLGNLLRFWGIVGGRDDGGGEQKNDRTRSSHLRKGSKRNKPAYDSVY